MVGVKFYTHEICLRSVKALCSALMDSVCGMCSRSPVLILVQCDAFKVCFSSSHRDLCYWIISNLRISYSRIHYTKKQNTSESNYKPIDAVLNAARLPAWTWWEEIRNPTDTTGSCTLSKIPKMRILSSFTHPHVVPNRYDFFFCEKIFGRILVTRQFRLHYMGKKIQ